MSEEQLKAFVEKVKADTSLQEKLKAAADVDAVVAIAKKAGFSVSAGDLKSAQSEISEEELEGVAAGSPVGSVCNNCMCHDGCPSISSVSYYCNTQAPAQYPCIGQ